MGLERDKILKYTGRLYGISIWRPIC